jgi:hypothetical protein
MSRMRQQCNGRQRPNRETNRVSAPLANPEPPYQNRLGEQTLAVGGEKSGNEKEGRNVKETRHDYAFS